MDCYVSREGASYPTFTVNSIALSPCKINTGFAEFDNATGCLQFLLRRVRQCRKMSSMAKL